MNFEHLDESLRENLRSFWRLRFALAATSGNSRHPPSMPVRYDGLPKHAPPDLFSRSETVAQAEEALLRLSGVPLATTFFLASIAHYEGFLQRNITIAKNRPMLGDLQTAAEGNASRPIGGRTRILAKEIRVRRNLLIHHGGMVNQDYTTAAIDAHPISDGAVALSAPGTIVEVTPAYFTYSTSVLIDYCRQVAGLNA